MLLFALVALSLFCPPSPAQEFDLYGPSFTYCEQLLGQFKGHAVSLDQVARTLEKHTDVRTLYRSNDPEANVFILVSRHRDDRVRLTHEVAGWLNLPIFVPGTRAEPRTYHFGEAPLEDVRTAPKGLINALARVERIGDIPSQYWDEGDTYLSYLDYGLRTCAKRQTCHHSSVATMALLQSEFDFGRWANQPIRTLLENVRLDSAGYDLGGEVVRKLAGIYYVGRAHEILED